MTSTLAAVLARPDLRQQLQARTLALTADGARLVSDTTLSMWFRCEGRRMVKVMDKTIEVELKRRAA